MLFVRFGKGALVGRLETEEGKEDGEGRKEWRCGSWLADAVVHGELYEAGLDQEGRQLGMQRDKVSSEKFRTDLSCTNPQTSGFLNGS